MKAMAMSRLQTGADARRTMSRHSRLISPRFAQSALGRHTVRHRCRVKQAQSLVKAAQRGPQVLQAACGDLYLAGQLGTLGP
jgi:hypothetical protein